MSRRFWNWEAPQPDDQTTSDPDGASVRVLRINGQIAEESWFADDITPALFASELNAGSRPVTIWLNSPGGDVVAAAQIYNLLTAYPGKVTVNIDGIAASAASVIAMAAETVAMSPVSMLMIHNPATLAIGDKDELAKALSMLEAVKDSIINAYQDKTGLSRAKLSRMMDAETWMDATAAIQLGFADQLLTTERHPLTSQDPDGEEEEEKESGKPQSVPPGQTNSDQGVVFARRPCEQRLIAACASKPPEPKPKPKPDPVDSVQPARPCGRRVVGEETQITTVSALNPAFNEALIARLRELTADPERGDWQTWIARYDLASDSFDHTFLWPGEDDGYNVLAYDTPMSAIEKLNPAHRTE